VCDLETSKMRRLKPASGLQKPVKERKKFYVTSHGDSEGEWTVGLSS
jgi:hypothetical protein